MHECRMVETLPAASTTVTWLLPAGGGGSEASATGCPIWSRSNRIFA